ncbi:MAG TPA: trypsin-like peptidase domain-containing protein [Blastocatellia bacterium]|nr:trypsin-like peptidase domain-containing protein [Blastocatellia bacterium]
MKPKITSLLALILPLWPQADFNPLAAPAHTFAAAVGAQSPKRSRSLSPESQSNIRQAISAVGLILVRNSNDPEQQGPRPRGSAVVVREDGVVVTSHHVIARDKSTQLYDEIYFARPVDGRVAAQVSGLYRLKPVVLNKALDLALLKVADDASGSPARMAAIEIGDSRTVRELDDLAIIGYPEKGGASVTVNLGTVEGKDILENWIKTDARLIHGNSGGAAVDSRGKLIGIPTKVVVDRQPTDKDGDGFPDGYYTLGAVGFLRPSYIVSSMLAQIDASAVGNQNGLIDSQTIATPQLTVTGYVKSAVDGKPIGGAAVGLVPLGTEEVSAKNILTWAYTDPDGRFTLNRAVPAGQYTLQAKTFGYEVFRRDVSLNPRAARLVIELRRSE